jgi:hypothetical protein
MTTSATAPTAGSTRGGATVPLDEQWQLAPGLPVLLRAAEETPGTALESQVEWSKRLRAVGLWSSCPLIATAQNGAAQSVAGSQP